MTLTALLRRTLVKWGNWKSRKAMHRAVPQLREYERQLAEHRRNHRCGSARIVRAKQKAVLEAMGKRGT